MLYPIMYHYVRNPKNSKYAGIKGLDKRLFEQQIMYLNSRYHIVTMEEVMKATVNKEELPDKSVLLAFDNGYIDHYTNVFPILMKYKLQGTFFVSGMTFSEHRLLVIDKLQFILDCGDRSKVRRYLLEQLDFYRDLSFTYEDNDALYERYAVANLYEDRQTAFIRAMLLYVLPAELRDILLNKTFLLFVGAEEERLARELYMNRDQVACLKQCGMHIGIQGYHYFCYEDIEERMIENDILQGIDAASEYIDMKHWAMNAPYGIYTKKMVEFLRKRGCQLGMLTQSSLSDQARFQSFDECDLPILKCFESMNFPPFEHN